jgi:cytochrome c553
MGTNKRQQNVDEALASFRNEGLEVDAYLQSQLNEYLAGRMTKKMMLQMLDEAYLEEVVKDRQGGKTIKVNTEDLV